MIRSRRFATAIATLALVMGLIPAPAAAAVQLLPDLGMAPPIDFSLDRQGGGTVLLRFSTVVVNVGSGPFEAYGYASTGDTADERHIVVQPVHNDDGSSTDLPTSAWMFFAGDGHNHWHVYGFQEWTLASATASAQVLRTGKKIGFCFWDNYVWGSTQPVYYYPNTTSACHEMTDASDTSVVPMGLSIGWGDEYPASLPDQYIDISGLPFGDYVLTLTADPAQQFTESNETNNTGTTYLRIKRNGVQVLGSEGYVPPVSSSPPPSEFTLSVTGSQVHGAQQADLVWSDPNSGAAYDVDVLRDGKAVATTSNDGFYTDEIGGRGRGSYVYQVCHAGGIDVCSPEVTLTL